MGVPSVPSSPRTPQYCQVPEAFDSADLAPEPEPCAPLCGHQRSRRWSWAFLGAGGLAVLGLVVVSSHDHLEGYAQRKGRRQRLDRPLTANPAAKTQLFDLAYQYHKFTSGDCTEHGLTPITDEAECRMAGKFLGLPSLNVFRTSLAAAEEEFCFFFQKNLDIPATLWMGTKDLLDGDFKLLCASKEAADATSVATLATSSAVLDAKAPMTWVGCFQVPTRTNRPVPVERHLQTLSSKTSTCSETCVEYKNSFMSMEKGGECTCLTGAPDAELVADSSCGDVCHGEGDLTPKRYCGGQETQAVFAVFRVKVGQSDKMAMSWVGCFKKETRARTDSKQHSAPASKKTANMSAIADTNMAAMSDALGLKSLDASPKLQTGSSSVACFEQCQKRGLKWMSLRDGGVCTCLSRVPTTVVPDSSCGEVCAGERSLSPERYCGGNGTQAIFQIKAGAPGAWHGHTALLKAPKKTKSTQEEPEVLKGICYAPIPLRSKREPSNGKPLADDDFMSDGTAGLWGPDGRHDLKTIRLLGANAVRLYGNDPGLHHKKFLDEALVQQLRVVTGISDYPYTQMEGNCLTTNNNCYSQVKSAYSLNLRNGFLELPEKRYHPALRTVIIVNEPDLKFIPLMHPSSFAKAVISAIDALLDAEKEMGVVGKVPNLTATFSFGICGKCPKYQDKPGLGQMIALKEAFKDPKAFGYEPKNDLWETYLTRFENSVNTANDAMSMKALFLDTYNEVMQGTPVFIGEYHAPMLQEQQQDLYRIVHLAEDKSNLLRGISFFEFQVRYDKGGGELAFGMFGLGERRLDSITVGRDVLYDAYCLTPMLSPRRVSKCGTMEPNVRYVVESDWAFNLTEPIPSPEMCCSRCLETPQCKSWTWEANPSEPAVGCSIARCWLHGGLPVRRQPGLFGHGTMSGLPPEGRVHTRSQQALADSLLMTQVTRAFAGPGLNFSALCPAATVLFLELTPAQQACGPK